MLKTKEMCKECKHANQTYLTAINAAYVGLQQVLREGFGMNIFTKTYFVNDQKLEIITGVRSDHHSKR